jgi:hypothetical protein
MVEVDIHLKLLFTSILDMHKVFGHIDMLTIGTWWQPYTPLYSPYLAQNLGLWVTCRVKMI